MKAQNYLYGQIETLMDLVESESALFFLEGCRSAINKACDPLDCNQDCNNDMFKRIILALQVLDSVLASGSVKIPTRDRELIEKMLSVQNLPI